MYTSDWIFLERVYYVIDELVLQRREPGDSEPIKEAQLMMGNQKGTYLLRWTLQTILHTEQTIKMVKDKK